MRTRDTAHRHALESSKSEKWTDSNERQMSKTI